MNEVKELKKIIRESDEMNESAKQRCGEFCQKLEVSEKTIATLQTEKTE